MTTPTRWTRLTRTRLRLNYLNWPRPHSHLSATSPRNQQPPKPTRERSGTSNLSSYWHTTVRPVTCTSQTGPGQISLTQPLEHPTPSRDTSGHPGPWAGSPEHNLRTSTEGSYTGAAGVAWRSDRSKPGNPKSSKQTFWAPKPTKLEIVAT
jgi:hypothetical protein